VHRACAGKHFAALEKERPLYDYEKQSLLKTGFEAAGIPARGVYGDFGKLSPGQLADFVIQQHQANRAGLHNDIRFGSPESGLFSWSTRKELPLPGAKTMLVQQPLHHHSYGSFQGELKGGYGAGQVRRKRKGQILLTNVEPNKVEFTTADERFPQRFLLLRPPSFAPKNWLLVNTTPRDPVGPYTKQHFTKIPAGQVEQELAKMQGGSFQEKIDGASSLVKLLKDGVEISSYRQSAGGRPIIHTERVFGDRAKGLDIPPHLVDSVLRGEIYGSREPTGTGVPATVPERGAGGGRGLAASPGGFGTDHVIGPQELGGLLNSTVAKSRADQQARRVKLKNALFDIEQYGKQPVSFDTVSYAERQKMLQEILPHLPAGHFHLPRSASTPEEALKLWQDIKAGVNPLTREGAVFHPDVGRPWKAKLLDEQDVHVTGVFPGEGKYHGTHAGGFDYALEPGGEPVGRVGAGISDELRQDMWAHPELYVGRVAKVRSQGPFESGALRAPAFLAMHEDPDTEKAAWDSWPKAADDAEHVPTVAVDLDGTLAENLPEFDPQKIGEPRRGAKKWMKRFRRAGARIIIFTVRGDKQLVKEWLEKHEIPYDFLNENPDQPVDSSGKVLADIYWDDRGISAAGPLADSAPEVLERLKAANDEFPFTYSRPEDVLQFIYLLQDAG
jgi:hypothetical protein